MKAKPKTVRVRVSFECGLDGWLHPTVSEARVYVLYALHDFRPLKRLRVERVPEKRRAK